MGKERNKFFNIRVEKEITMRELSKLTGISVIKICKFGNNHAIPTKEELKKINNILKSNLKEEDFDYDEESEKQLMASIEAVNKAHQHYKKNKKNIFKIKCPSCGKHIHCRRSDYNGQIWGVCETENCIKWME